VTVNDEFQSMWKEESVKLANRPNSFEYVASSNIGKTQATQNCMREELTAD
jgi:hypothetical protein